MTDEQVRELGLRAVACRPMHGGVAHWWPCGERHKRDEYGVLWHEPDEGEEQWWPDLRDAATKGCLLELVREAWGDDALHPEKQYEGSWVVWPQCTEGGWRGHGATEGEALVAALEAAP